MLGTVSMGPRTSRRWREHRATRREARDLAGKVVVKRLGTTKGMGVVARRDLEVGEFVGVLPGRVIPDRIHVDMTVAGWSTGVYAMETRDRTGEIHVVDPEDPVTHRPFSHFRESVGLYINEPAPGERLNVAWAHNKAYDPERVDCYTAKPVRKGQELLVHYGTIYERRYRRPFERPLPSWDLEKGSQKSVAREDKIGDPESGG